MPQTGSAANASSEPRWDTSLWWRLWFPAIISALLLAIQLHYLFENLDGRDLRAQARDRVALATVLSKTNQVRHKFGGTLIWETPENGETVYRSDAMATMAKSQALIEFKDHSQILIEPDSLIVFEEVPASQDGGRRIVARLVRGSIVRQKSGSIPLFLKFSQDPEAKEHRFEDTRGDAVFRVVLKAHGVEVTVESGNVVVDGGRSLASGDTLPIEQKLPAPLLKKPRIDIRPLPTPSSSLWDWIVRPAYAEEAAEVSIQFEWEPIEKAKSYRVQISSDPKFDKILLEKEVPKAEFTYDAPSDKIGSEVYFRVAGVGQSGRLGDYSAVERVEIKKVAPEAPPVIAQQKPQLVPEPKVAKKKVTPPAEKKVAVLKLEPKSESKVEPRAESRVELPQKPSAEWHGELVYGAVLGNRKIEQKGFPQTVSGSGFVPSRIAAEIEVGHDGPDFWNLRFGGSYLFETFQATTIGVSTEKVAIPLARAWVLYGEKRGVSLIGVGPYFASTSELAWGLGEVTAKFKALGGMMIDFIPKGTRLNSTGSVLWRNQLGIIAVGTFGADFLSTIRFSLGSPFFFGVESNFRVTSIETSYGGAIELGISL